jgi:hypothetical protein
MPLVVRADSPGNHGGHLGRSVLFVQTSSPSEFSGTASTRFKLIIRAKPCFRVGT